MRFLLCLFFFPAILAQDCTWQEIDHFSMPRFNRSPLLSFKGQYLVDDFRSTDGKTWEELDLNAETFVSNGDTVIAFSFSNRDAVFRSSDGISWTTHDAVLPLDFVSYQGTPVLYDGQRFIISNDDGVIAVSNDGISWQVLDINSDGIDLGRVAFYGAGLYFAEHGINQTYVSSDLINWQPSHSFDNPDYANSWASNGERVLAILNYRLYYTDDGTNWHETSHAENDLTAEYLTYANGQFLIMGETTATSANGYDFSPVDDTNHVWDDLFSGQQGFLVTDSEHVFFASPNGLFRSSDGMDWQRLGFRASDLINLQTNSQVVVSFSGTTPFISSDMIHWQMGTGINKAVAGPSASGLIWTGQNFVVQTSRGIFISPDGYQWQKTLSAQFGSLFGNGEVLFFGYNDQFWRSADHGLTWTRMDMGRWKTLVSYGDHAVGLQQTSQRHRLFWSSDKGASWHRVPDRDVNQSDEMSLGQQADLFEFQNDAHHYYSYNGRDWARSVNRPSSQHQLLAPHTLRDLQRSLSNTVEFGGQTWASDGFSIYYSTCGLDEFPVIEASFETVIPWVVNNETWTSRITYTNLNNHAVSLSLTAHTAEGETQEQSIQIPANGVFSQEAELLFPGLTRYALWSRATQDGIYPSFILRNTSQESGGASPAQTTGALVQDLGGDIHFGTIPGEPGAAIVLTTTSSSSGTLVLYNEAGEELARTSIDVPTKRPLAMQLVNLFPDTSLPTQSRISAHFGSQRKVTGTTFYFNTNLQPSMARTMTFESVLSEQ